MEIRANILFVDDSIPSRVPPGEFTRQELREIHATRGELSVDKDDELYATPAETQAEWLAQPNRRDIRGIDEFPLQVQRDFAQHFPDYIAQLEEYYDTDVMPETSYQIHRNRESFQKAYAEIYHGVVPSGVLGFAYDKPDGSGEIHMDQRTTEVFKKGFIENPRDLMHFEVVFHELGHRIGPTGYRQGSDAHTIGKRQEYFAEGFDEGSNEILAQRFIINNVKMDPQLRRKVTATPDYDGKLYEQISTYEEYQRLVGKMALIASNGDLNEGVKWIEDIRYAPNEEVAEKRKRQFVDQVLKARKKAEKDPEKKLRAMTLPGNEKEATNLLMFSKHPDPSIRNQLDNVIKELELRDPWEDPPKRFLVDVYGYDYELVRSSRRDTVIKKKIPGSKKKIAEQKIPWWMVV